MKHSIMQVLALIEKRNRGWINAENAPVSLLVNLDGKPLEHVIAVHRKKGKAIVAHYPLRLNKYRNRVLTYTVYGHVTLETFTDEPSPR